ncbi:MAG: outer membrane protein transport protein [bacterium]
MPNRLAAWMLLTLTCPALGWAANPVPDSRLEIPSSFNPVGSGARALGMGGAFIPVADDATAASWNPGGLVQLEKPEISIVGAGLWRTEDNHFALRPEGSHQGDVNATRLNYLSASYPFKALDRNMILSLNYQNLFEFDRDWKFPLHTASGALDTTDQHHYTQDGALYALGLAYAVQITPAFSVGATLNLWDDWFQDNGWQQRYRIDGAGTLGGQSFLLHRDKTEDYAFRGRNANLGFLWQLTSQWTLGGVIKTPFDADIRHRITESYQVQFPEQSGFDVTTDPTTSRQDETLRMPLAYGLGLAYRHNDRLSFAVDLYRTEWSQFSLTGADGVKRSPLSGHPLSDTRLDDTLWVRAGVEYLTITDNYVIPLRAGLFYDPAPADGGHDDFYGLSLGTGLGYQRFIFDLAYQYRWGNHVGTASLPQVGLSQDISEHRLYASLIVHF